MRFLLSFVLLLSIALAVSLVSADQTAGGNPVPSKTVVNATKSGVAGTVFNLFLHTFDSLGAPAACVDFSEWDVLFSYGVVNSTFVSCVLGVYKIDFYPQSAGQNSIAVSLFGVYVNSGPVSFTVYSGPIFTCSFLGSSGITVGLNITLGLVCYDEFLNPVSTCYGQSSWSIYFSSYYTSSRYLVYQSCSVESSLSLDGLLAPQSVSEDSDEVQELPVAVTYFGFGDVTRAYTYSVVARLNYISLQVPSILFIAGGINLNNSVFTTSTQSTYGTLSFTPYDDYNNLINPYLQPNDYSFSACPNKSVSANIYVYTTYVTVSYSLLNKPAGFCVLLSVIDENNQESVVGGTFKGEVCLCELDDELSLTPSAFSKRLRGSASAEETFQIEVEFVVLMVGLAIVGWLVGLLCGVLLRRVKPQVVVEAKQTVVTF